MTAVLDRKYYCSKRKAQGIKPFNFRNFDPKVIANEPDYVKVQWERSGFDFLHQSGLSMPLLKGVMYSLNYGIGVQGFRQTLKENLKCYHLHQSIMWRDYVDSIVEVGQPSGGRLFQDAANIDTIQVGFPDFNSEMYHQSIPSNLYLISRVIKLMESNAEYKKR